MVSNRLSRAVSLTLGSTALVVGMLAPGNTTFASSPTGLSAGSPAQAVSTGEILGTLASPDELPAAVLQGVKQAGDNAAVGQAAPRYRAYFVFQKNRRNPTNSRLTLYRTRLTDGRTYRVGRWRAGSGDATKDRGRNPCAVDHGWLPNGWYNGVAHYKNFNNGGPIFGTVWQLQDKECADGKLRTQLFIHSEMTPAGGQACSRSKYREEQCWDGISDYKSEGCIKLKPADVKEAASLARRLGGPKLGQRNFANLLYVTGG